MNGSLVGKEGNTLIEVKRPSSSTADYAVVAVHSCHIRSWWIRRWWPWHPCPNEFVFH